MKNRIFADYSRIDLNSVEGRKKFFGAITHYMQSPMEAAKKLIEAGTTQFTATSDFGQEVKALIERYHLGLYELDNGWAQFFDVRDFSGVRNSGFKIRTASSGLTFSKQPEGGRAQIYRVTGSEQFVGFDTYGGGLEFDNAWFQDEEWWMIEDTAAEFRAKWFTDKATTMYDLIGNLGAGYNVAYDATGADELAKDIITLNTAAAALLTAMRAAGYAVTPQTPVKVLSPLQLMPRLNRALNAAYLTPGIAGASHKVEYSITPVYSLNVRNAGAAATNVWYMGIPGMKNKYADKMPLTVYTDFKSEYFATQTVGWGRYGAYLNEAQWRRIATA